MNTKNKGIIAWGTGNAFINHVKKYGSERIDYVVDDFRCNSKVAGTNVYHPDKLFKENIEDVFVVVFTLSSDIYQKIAKKLSDRRFNYSDYSILVKKQFASEMKQHGILLKDNWYPFIHSLFVSMPVANHSSLLGSWLINGLLYKTQNVLGNAIELGVYQGGNAYCAVVFLKLLGDKRKYIMVDSFEGFDNQFTDTSYKTVHDLFNHFDNVKIIKGNIPEILDSFTDTSYSFVYLDCDLNKPTIASLEYFYPRLSRGGVLLVDDYCVTQGFLDVRKIVDKFCKEHKLTVIEIPETTHGVIMKE